MKDITAETQRAHDCLQQALPHIEEARAILADALGIDEDTRPEAAPGNSEERRQAVRLMQNAWSAHLHVTDCFGS